MEEKRMTENESHRKSERVGMVGTAEKEMVNHQEEKGKGWRGKGKRVCF